MKQELADFKDIKDRQINNIYEMLDVLTNESKAKYKYIDESNNNNVSKEDYTTPTACNIK
jgi:hypothetical protein